MGEVGEGEDGHDETDEADSCVSVVVVRLVPTVPPLVFLPSHNGRLQWDVPVKPGACFPGALLWGHIAHGMAR